ncbi:OsmC family protein [Litoreibacter roseus]|uniref:Osmotically inducible protein OsmC n=1 Tax=Litoreibacter roseus TaxID=2601869 RepID=A0A6N6JHL4_9RHOB|nr:OsmC family protein [Litoreibacter roseus]GFE65821.1 osmotically inducible protein OsmC [Litoreibacter roseus]
MTVNTGSAIWRGGLKDGKGNISAKSGVLENVPYGFAKRFEGEAGTNPEELIGAAHASCFSMALSMVLGEHNLTADEIKTSADVTLEQVDGGFAVTKSHLTVTARIPGASEDAFAEAAKTAKENCPISKLLNADITMDASLD